MESKKVFGIIIISVMLLSTFAVVLDYVSPQNNVRYNGILFRQVENQFVANINGEDKVFVFYPADLEFINLSSEVKSAVEKPVVTVTYNPQSVDAEALAEAQYYLELQLAGKTVIDRAVTNNTDLALPQKTCADATDAQPVLSLEIGNESDVRLENDCIRVMGYDFYDLFQKTERMIYHVLGVI